MSNKTLDEQLAELKALVEELNDPKVDIDRSVALFEKGITLSKEIEEKLNTYQMKLSVLAEGEIK